MDPGETTLESINSIGPSEFVEPKKKRGRPSNAEKELKRAQEEKKQSVFEERYRSFVEEYLDFCDEYPDYAFGEPRITKPIDLDRYEAQLAAQKKKIRLNRSIDALPLNFHFLVDGLVKLGSYGAIQFDNPVLAMRLMRFQKLVEDEERYAQIEEILIKLLRKYPRLQTSELWPEVQLIYVLGCIWSETAVEEPEFEMEEDEIPDQFRDM